MPTKIAGGKDEGSKIVLAVARAQSKHTGVSGRAREKKHLSSFNFPFCKAFFKPFMLCCMSSLLLLLLLPSSVQPLSSVLHPARHPIWRISAGAPNGTPAQVAGALEAEAEVGAGASQPGSSTSYTMMDSSGRSFSCAVPSLPEGGAAATEAEGGLKLRQAVVEALLAAAAPSALCAVLHKDYWSYEVCLPSPSTQGASTVRQWHSSGPTEPPGSVQVLGALQPGRDALEYTPSGARYLAQHFQGGTGGRSAEVRWVCARNWPGVLPRPAAAAAAAAVAAAAGDAAAAAVPVLAALELISVTEDPPLHYTLLVGSYGEAACELLPSPQALLAPLNHTCVEYIAGGWWT